MSAADLAEVRALDFEGVRRILPQRFPFILVDRVTELEPGTRIVAVKNVTANEPHFVGHFPDQAVMPGVFIIEAAAQAVAIMCRTTTGEEARAYLASTAMAFRRVVIPGDQMLIEATVSRRVSNLVIAKVKVRVSGAVVADGEITVAQKD